MVCVVLKNIALPEDFDDPRSILFKTTHTIAEVWLDGEKIYEYGNEEDAPSFMKSPGSCWHIVNIPEDSAGKSLEVRIIPVYDNYYGNEVSIVYGTRGNCVLKILMDSFKTLLLSCGIPVSYTHLDVYKRQTVDCDGPSAVSNNFTGAGSVGFPSNVMIACTWNTVSYTHLDVYKRQVHCLLQKDRFILCGMEKS